MKLEDKSRNKFIQRYLGQGEKLPASVRELIGKLSGGTIQLYALVDLNASLKFSETWIVVTEQKLYIALERAGEALIEKEFELSRIAQVREVRSLSCTSLTFIEAHDLPSLAQVTYTHRQKIIMGHIKYYCETFKNEKSGENFFMLDHSTASIADDRYQEAVMKPIVEAQNSITSENAQTLIRLLGYLRPYRRELTLGTLGAVATTLVSLVPAYLSGRLIDQVVKPFQDGSLSFEEASAMGWIMVGALGVTYVLREFFIYIRLNKMSILRGESSEGSSRAAI